MKQVALFVTYTMIVPVVGGAFFRALRLAAELQRRGWEPVICNNGPMLIDPKIEQARERIRLLALNHEAPGLTSQAAGEFFRAFDPAVVIFGEGPFETMQLFYAGAQLVRRPFVVLDQFYNRWLLPDCRNVDLALLYGLRTFWPERRRLPHPYVMIPPFIEAVTPKAALPVPAELQGLPWVTVIAYEPEILRQGVALVGDLRDRPVGIIVVSHQPAEAGRLLAEVGVAPAGVATLPLQGDATVFGLMGASRVTIVSNGFLQIMEALAMACPVICVDRGGVGITSFNIDRRFASYVSIGENAHQQRERLRRWLEASPFSARQRAALQAERNGAQRCADLIEALVARGPARRTLRQRARRFLDQLRPVT